MKPYFERDGVTLYCGDCREVLPGLAADVTITDPPYNCGKNYGRHSDRMSTEEYQAWLRNIFGLCAAVAQELVYFPGTRNLLEASRCIPPPLRPHRTLGWHKKEYAGDKWNDGPAMCWEPVVWASARERPGFNKRFGWRGRDFLVVPATHGDPFAKLHPCPKPQPVLDWLVGLFAPEGGTILDPFAGTGTTLKAARDHGCKAIGVEQEERFCEASARRLEQGVLQF